MQLYTKKKLRNISNNVNSTEISTAPRAYISTQHSVRVIQQLRLIFMSGRLVAVVAAVLRECNVDLGAARRDLSP